ncbi:MAG: ABC transporter permease, partial [Mesorhizobium sp.]
MSAFLARNRLIVLAYAGMVVLLLVTALFSPGFLSVSNMRSTVVLAAFVGIVALGQTFVIIGGGIDLSVPIIMTLATNVILQGLILVLTGGSPTPSAPTLIQFLSVGRIAGFPVIALIWLALTLVATVLLSKAAFGRHLYALGTS